MKVNRLIAYFLISSLMGCNTGDPCTSCHGQLPGFSDPRCPPTQEVECEGDACATVKSKFSEISKGCRQTQIENSSNKKVILQIRWSNSLQCYDEQTYVLDRKQKQGFAFRAFCTPYSANFVSDTEPVTSISQPPNIVNFSISPSTAKAGNYITFTISLDRPSPPGGSQVGLSYVSEQSVFAAFKQFPPSTIDFGSGEQTRVITVESDSSLSVPTKIVWTAFNMSCNLSNVLQINP